MTNLAKPARPTVAYRAALLIFNEGPTMRGTLFSRIDFGAKECGREASLKRAIDAGWLVRSEHGVIDITDEARDLLEECAEQPSGFVGIVAAPRSINNMIRPAWKGWTRIRRDDEPEWSIRPAGFTICTIA
jgi:hypothetical protein